MRKLSLKILADDYVPSRTVRLGEPRLDMCSLVFLCFVLARVERFFDPSMSIFLRRASALLHRDGQSYCNSCFKTWGVAFGVSWFLSPLTFILE